MVQDLHTDPAVYPHFDIYPSAPGDCIDRSYGSSDVPSPSTVRTQGHGLSASLSVSNTKSSLKVDQIGYPTLNICMYLPSPVINNIISPLLLRVPDVLNTTT